MLSDCLYPVLRACQEVLSQWGISDRQDVYAPSKMSSPTSKARNTIEIVRVPGLTSLARDAIHVTSRALSARLPAFADAAVAELNPISLGPMLRILPTGPGLSCGHAASSTAERRRGASTCE